MNRLKSLKAISIVALLATSAAPALAENISEKFAASAATSQAQVDYRPIGQFTDAFCTVERSRVQCAYDAMGQQGERFLNRYESYLSNVPVSRLSKDDQLAYWLNTRNMLVVHAIAESKSRRSLKDGRGTFAAPGEMWTKKRITVEGVELSIQDIESDILLANFDDANLIYGMYQGTKGGPAMQKTGFTGDSVHADLAKLGKSFVNSRNGVRVKKGKADINAIYDWYGPALFGGDDAKFKAHLASHATGKRASGLSSVAEFKTAKFSYSTDNFVIRQQSAAARTGGGTIGGAGGGGSFGGS